MDIEKLKQNLCSTFIISKTDTGCLVNNRFISYGTNSNDMPVAVVELPDGIVLTDVGLTYERLKDVDIELDNKQLEDYRSQIFDRFGIQSNSQNELFTLVENEQNLPTAICRFLQALIVINNIDLQFDD